MIDLLTKLIKIPSHSRAEAQACDLLQHFLESRGVATHRRGENVWALNRRFDSSKPTILLNSHIDTVKPSPTYTRDPYSPDVENGRLYGLGSNDAGASVVGLTATFLHFYEQDIKYNLCLALTAQEEISGSGGIESILGDLPAIDFAVVGEPTRMQMAVAERGLLVVDCTAHGVAGHAARNEGDNAILHAMRDIEWLTTFRFPRVSPTLGEVKMSVTQIEAGSAHNVVPDKCRFVVDIRMTECYTHQEILDIIAANVSSQVVARSTRLRPSSIPTDHPFVEIGLAMGLEAFGSPTTSDQALLSCPSLKMGIGDSARSHTADEFVYVTEIEEGIDQYIAMFTKLLLT